MLHRMGERLSDLAASLFSCAASPGPCLQSSLRGAEVDVKRLSADLNNAHAGINRQESEKRALQQAIDDQARQVRGVRRVEYDV